MTLLFKINTYRIKLNVFICPIFKETKMNEIDINYRLMMEWHTAKQESNIRLMIQQFKGMSFTWSCDEEIDASDAKVAKNKAQKKIRELKLEIEKQESAIIEAERVIRRYKSVRKKMSTSVGKGRPLSDEYRVGIAKKFVSKWFLNLMEVLEVKSCHKLEQIISTTSTKFEISETSGKLEEIIVPSKATERNLRRWLKGDAIPNYNTFQILMSTKVEAGKYKGKLLQDVPTDPNVSDLQTLLHYT
jgi:hypothetical protein